eukprot:3157031-Rhodomonas_salina.6
MPVSGSACACVSCAAASTACPCPPHLRVRSHKPCPCPGLRARPAHHLHADLWFFLGADCSFWCRLFAVYGFPHLLHGPRPHWTSNPSALTCMQSRAGRVASARGEAAHRRGCCAGE